MNRGVILNIILAGAVLGTAFLSQHSYFRSSVKNADIPLIKKGEAFSVGSYTAKIEDWFKNTVYPNISEEVIKRGEAAKEQIKEQKNNVEEKAVSDTKKFIAEKILQAIGVKPEDLIQCKPQE